MAFNKRIVVELELRLPRHVIGATFNSVGYKAWRSYVGKYVKVQANKTWMIMKEMLHEDDIEKYASFIKKMVGLAKSAGIGGHLLEDTTTNWEALRAHHNVYVQSGDASTDYGITLSQIVLRESIKQAKNIIDFDDQIYMPYLRDVSFPKYDRLFIDEFQDTNEVQIELMKKMIKYGGKVIAVGDTDQAIYGFRGADSEAMNRGRKAFDCQVLPLSITYRCSKAVTREAQKYVSKIEYFDGAKEGLVEAVEKYNATDFLPTDAILCRNNAPLVKMAYGFIRRGIGINMPGRDLGAGLKIFIKKMKAKNVDDLEIKAVEWLGNQRDNLIEKGQEDKIEALNDKIECLEVIIENLDYADRTINALLAEIDYLFKASEIPAISLMSIHKSKGDEWNRVFILDFAKLMPSKYAKQPWQKMQENNLIYVAITRAKSYVGYIDSGVFSDDDGDMLEERRAQFKEARAKARVSAPSKKKWASKKTKKPKANKAKPIKKGKVTGGLSLGGLLR
jgi:superfamily I DNA/RNA helicase